MKMIKKCFLGFLSGQSSHGPLSCSKHLISIQGPDDRILNCCLQFQPLVRHIFLLTNDKNLACKALASYIKSFPANEIHGKLNALHDKMYWLNICVWKPNGHEQKSNKIFYLTNAHGFCHKAGAKQKILLLFCWWPDIFTKFHKS